jgi:hypothetical protein
MNLLSSFQTLSIFTVFYFYSQSAYNGSKLTGDWSDIPDSLVSLQLRSLNITNAPVININNFSKNSNLEYFMFNNGGFVGDGAFQRKNNRGFS